MRTERWEHPGRRQPGEGDLEFWKRGRDLALGPDRPEPPAPDLWGGIPESEPTGLGTFNAGMENKR